MWTNKRLVKATLAKWIERVANCSCYWVKWGRAYLFDHLWYSNDPPSLCWKIKRSKMIRIQIPMLLLKMNINMPWLHTAQEFSLQQRGVDTLSSKYLRQQSTATMWAQIPMTPWHCMTVDYIRLRWHDDTDCNHSSVSWRHLNLGRRLKSCRQSRCWSMLSS